MPTRLRLGALPFFARERSNLKVGDVALERGYTLVNLRTLPQPLLLVQPTQRAHAGNRLDQILLGARVVPTREGAALAFSGTF